MSILSDADELVATDAARHIAVVGGGPGGMEVARRLSLRGHRVSLFEAGSRLGGTLQFASIPYEPNQRLLRWLRAQVQASSVEVHLDAVAPSVLRFAQQSRGCDTCATRSSGRRCARTSLSDSTPRTRQDSTWVWNSSAITVPCAR